VAKLISRASASFRDRAQSGARRLAVTTFLLCPFVAMAGSAKKATPPEPPRVRATVQPAFTIPVEPLGFTAPASFYLGTRVSVASLDFLDENHLLFTFRVPGLIHRDPRDLSGSDPGQERQIRALVLRLPD